MEELNNENELKDDVLNENNQNKSVNDNKQTSYTTVSEETTSIKVDNKIYEVPIALKPISSWGYFGFMVLFSVPFIGFIIMTIFALGGTKNVNLKNFARSQFCFILVVLILIGITFFITGATTIFSRLININFN